MQQVSVSVRVASAAIGCAVVAAPVMVAQGQHLLWVKEVGPAWQEYALSADGAGGSFLAGTRAGHSWDAWLVRLDNAGVPAWERQFGTTEDEYGYAVTSDSAGGAYIAGGTRGSLGQPAAGALDAWIGRFDSAGEQIWIRQFGTSVNDVATALVPDDAGGVYAAGWTAGALAGPSAGFEDAWIARYDSGGNQLWLRQFGSGVHDRAAALAPDGSGGVFVAGREGQFSGVQAVLGRFDRSGDLYWLRRCGTTGEEMAHALAPDGAGGAYVAGRTNTSGAYEAWLGRYDAAGTELWVEELGTDSYTAHALAPDDAGGVYIAGSTNASYGGPLSGAWDAWIARYNSAGGEQWLHQQGTERNDYGVSLAPDGAGGAYLAGDTHRPEGAILWLARYGDTCPPDCDGSGSLDFFDFLCFQNLFAAGDPQADCDESGELDFFDFLCFQNQFAAGCP